MRNAFWALLASLLASTCLGFAIPAPKLMVHQQSPAFLSAKPLFMSEGEDTKTEEGGDLYDDEVEEYKDSLSDTMRERLLREASTGLDPDVKQTNVILYIIIGVAILVILGGAGIFY